jgi:hypothetical protein
MTDNDGNEYSSININGVTWIKQNFKCTTYNNGDPIIYCGHSSNLYLPSYEELDLARTVLYDNRNNISGIYWPDIPSNEMRYWTSSEEGVVDTENAYSINIAYGTWRYDHKFEKHKYRGVRDIIGSDTMFQVGDRTRGGASDGHIFYKETLENGLIRYYILDNHELPERELLPTYRTYWDREEFNGDSADYVGGTYTSLGTGKTNTSLILNAYGGGYDPDLWYLIVIGDLINNLWDFTLKIPPVILTSEEISKEWRIMSEGLMCIYDDDIKNINL